MSISKQSIYNDNVVFLLLYDLSNPNCTHFISNINTNYNSMWKMYGMAMTFKIRFKDELLLTGHCRNYYCANRRTASNNNCFPYYNTDIDLY